MTKNRGTSRTKKRVDPWFESLEGHEVQEFVLDSYIGHGRIGYVYRAHRKDLGSEVAVKLVPGSPRTGWENELIKVSQLSTIAGVVHFHDLGTAQIKKGRTRIFQFTVWDYIAPGRNLRKYIAEVGFCPVSFLVAVVEQILRVLHACSVKGIPRHGDLHAGNILIGEQDEADLDALLHAREPIYVSDFGYGATGGRKKPKDDYLGLAEIANAIIEKVEWDAGSFTDRQMLTEIRTFIRKHLQEVTASERSLPRELLQTLHDCRRRASTSSESTPSTQITSIPAKALQSLPADIMKVGQFQVSEMLGDEWQLWKRLFVPSVPARSRILEPDISTVITGPRGCGKTMLLRRLSERLTVECGPIDDLPDASIFTGFYVNANDIADAFSNFPSEPTKADMSKLICYANLCILSEFLAIESARRAKFAEIVPDELLSTLRQLIVGDREVKHLVVGEDSLERYRSILERIKWSFLLHTQPPTFPGFPDLSQHTWLRHFVASMARICPWLSNKAVFVFIDDYTTPRVSTSMQKVLNRLLFQRSSDFVCKVATESATTFVTSDSSGKILQDGDDYRLIDIGEESLFMGETERAKFLEEVFARRLLLDPRVPRESKNLPILLGRLGSSKTEFARRLRGQLGDESTAAFPVSASSQRRGATRPKVLYHGWEVFTSLWSGDTRTMIQLVQELLDQAESRASGLTIPLDPELQDRVFRSRGGQWLETQARNQPTDKESVDRELQRIRVTRPNFNFTGGNYGNHLKAIVEAFSAAARQLLLGPTYKIGEGKEVREVPRMAFRIEIVDEFRISGLAEELYKDLIRYGLFMRDARGKSVRGAIVPRLYLRRLLLPFCTLAMSKRDSVPLTCDKFSKLLLEPDEFKASIGRQGGSLAAESRDQIDIPFYQEQADSRYDDLNGHQ